MNITQEIALIACKQCQKLESESEADYAVRLYDTFHDCLLAVEDAKEKKETETAAKQLINMENLM